MPKVACHTPGPWGMVRREPPHPEIRHKRTYWEIGSLETRKGVATAFSGEITGDDSNARLIAAAPELLDACIHAEAVLSIVEPRSDKAQYLALLVKLRSVVEKARG